MWGVLLLFFTMHLLDSVDRWLLAAVLPQVSDELNLSGIQAGWLSTVLLLGLAAASLPVGYLADRLRRRRLLATGFALWSMATVATGLAHSYDQIQLARAARGRRKRCDLRGCRTHDPDGPVSSSGSRTEVLAVFFLGGADGGGGGIRASPERASLG